MAFIWDMGWKPSIYTNIVQLMYLSACTTHKQAFYSLSQVNFALVFAEETNAFKNNDNWQSYSTTNQMFGKLF